MENRFLIKYLSRYHNFLNTFPLTSPCVKEEIIVSFPPWGEDQGEGSDCFESEIYFITSI